MQFATGISNEQNCQIGSHTLTTPAFFPAKPRTNTPADAVPTNYAPARLPNYWAFMDFAAVVLANAGSPVSF